MEDGMSGQGENLYIYILSKNPDLTACTAH